MRAVSPNDGGTVTDGITDRTVRENGWPDRVAGEAQGIRQCRFV